MSLLASLLQTDLYRDKNDITCGREAGPYLQITWLSFVLAWRLGSLWLCRPIARLLAPTPAGQSGPPAPASRLKEWATFWCCFKRVWCGGTQPLTSGDSYLRVLNTAIISQNSIHVLVIDRPSDCAEIIITVATKFLTLIFFLCACGSIKHSSLFASS